MKGFTIYACPSCGRTEKVGEFNTGTPNLACFHSDGVYLMVQLEPKRISLQPFIDKMKEDNENAQCNEMYCSHANEMPEKCPCEGPCYCKRHGGPCDTSW